MISWAYDGSNSAGNVLGRKVSALAVNEDLEQWIGGSVTLNTFKVLALSFRKS